MLCLSLNSGLLPYLCDILLKLLPVAQTAKDLPQMRIRAYDFYLPWHPERPVCLVSHKSIPDNTFLGLPRVSDGGSLERGGGRPHCRGGHMSHLPLNNSTDVYRWAGTLLHPGRSFHSLRSCHLPPHLQPTTFRQSRDHGTAQAQVSDLWPSHHLKLAGESDTSTFEHCNLFCILRTGTSLQ